MTERRAMEPLETQFADRVRAYADVATDRRIDALAVARTAMSSQRATGWSVGRLGAGLLDRRPAGLRWATAFVVVILVGVVAIAVQRRTPDTVGGPIPDVLRHSWQRPLPVAPGPDQWGSGFLSLASGQLEYGREPGAGASRAAITATGFDTLAVTATVETSGCAIGDVGAYRWLVEGKGTVMTLTAIRTDACSARGAALTGPWVRSDLPPPADSEPTLPPGTHQTSGFDPFGDPARSSQLSYTVPEGWKVKGDEPASFTLHHLPDAASGQRSTDTFLALFVQPRMAAELEDGATCGPSGDAPGVGASIDDLVAAIIARPGVISTPPGAVTIGGHEGRLLDLQLAPSWSRGCRAPEGLIVGVPIVHQAGSGMGPPGGPLVALAPDQPVRLILLDLADGRTMAIAIFDLGPSTPAQLQADLAEVMPIIASFEFRSSTP
jgi:hypothetical protein